MNATNTSRTLCTNCDNVIETGGCRCERPAPEHEPTRLEVLDCMQSMGGGFVSALAVAWMKADEDNHRRLLAAFPHYWRKYTETVKLQKSRVHGRVMKGGCGVTATPNTSGSPLLLMNVLDQIERTHIERRTPGAEYVTDRRMLEFVEHHIPSIIPAARVGVAASDLLAACEAALPPCERCGLIAVADQLRAAIAKAKGGAA